MPQAFKCRGCGIVKPHKWTYTCPNCSGFWDIKTINADIEGAENVEPVDGEVVSLQDAIDHVVVVPRIETGIEGVDYVLGGGFAKNSLTLLCGDPGIGKTTLLIQIFRAISKLRHDTLYITGEQMVSDIAQRAKSFGKFPGRMSVLRATDIDEILDIVEDRKPAIVAIDSVQTLYVEEDLEIGSSTTIKVAVRELMAFAKEQNIAFVLVGHVSKGGAIAGPKALEHFVDVNLYFSGSKSNPKRLLKCDSKNRYGETPREAKFKMTDEGLKDMTGIVEIEPKPPEPTAPTPTPLKAV